MNYEQQLRTLKGMIRHIRTAREITNTTTEQFAPKLATNFWQELPLVQAQDLANNYALAITILALETDYGKDQKDT